MQAIDGKNIYFRMLYKKKVLEYNSNKGNDKFLKMERSK